MGKLLKTLQCENRGFRRMRILISRIWALSRQEWSRRLFERLIMRSHKSRQIQVQGKSWGLKKIFLSCFNLRSQKRFELSSTQKLKKQSNWGKLDKFKQKYLKYDLSNLKNCNKTWIKLKKNMKNKSEFLRKSQNFDQKLKLRMKAYCLRSLK